MNKEEPQTSALDTQGSNMGATAGLPSTAEPPTVVVRASTQGEKPGNLPEIAPAAQGETKSSIKAPPVVDQDRVVAALSAQGGKLSNAPDTLGENKGVLVESVTQAGSTACTSGYSMPLKGPTPSSSEDVEEVFFEAANDEDDLDDMTLLDSSMSIPSQDGDITLMCSPQSGAASVAERFLDLDLHGSDSGSAGGDRLAVGLGEGQGGNTDDDYTVVAPKGRRIRNRKPKNYPKTQGAGTETSSATPSTSGSKDSRKRPRESGDTPKQVIKKPRTYALAVGQDKVILIEFKDNPYLDLTREDSDQVRSDIINLIDEWDEDSEVVPRFKESGLVQGKFKVTCADDTSVEWLINAVKSLKSPGGKSYNARRATDPIPLMKGAVWIPGPQPHTETQVVLKRLQKQNKSLKTERWKIYSRGSKDPQSGFYLIFGLDMESVEALRAMRFRPYYELRQIKFRITGLNSPTEMPKKKTVVDAPGSSTEMSKTMATTETETKE